MDKNKKVFTEEELKQVKEVLKDSRESDFVTNLFSKIKFDEDTLIDIANNEILLELFVISELQFYTKQKRQDEIAIDLNIKPTDISAFLHSNRPWSHKKLLEKAKILWMKKEGLLE